MNELRPALHSSAAASAQRLASLRHASCPVRPGSPSEKILPRRFHRSHRQVHPARGFAMVTVVFVLIALAAIVASVSGLLTRGAQATVIDVHQARATEAARAALQWAAWQVRDPRGTQVPGATALPNCFASPSTVSLPAPLDAYSVSVSCSRTPDASASPNYYSEDQRRLAVFVLTATASVGGANAPDRVERRLEMRVESCKDPVGDLPDFRC
jgi:MSHA biogenesis protein MshP